jgi:hypothetical protein
VDAPVEELAEAGAEAAPAVEPEPPVASSPEPPGPPPSFFGRSRLWLALGCAAVLILAVAWTVAGRRKLSPDGGTGVAVVGFRNLSPRQVEGWEGTALAEMLAADLDRGGAPGSPGGTRRCPSPPPGG